jgi:MYXO-CTERM domain-containing protein
MKHVRLTWLAVFATLAVLTAGAPAGAQTFDNRTIVTISAPVQLPGRTLAAGKYVFKLHDSPGARHIVQVYSGDESQLITTLLAIAAERQQVTDETVITFAERESTRPPAVRYWFYPARKIGHEFVYPKDQAMQIARASNTPVQATDSPMGTAEQMQSAEVTVVNPADANAQAAPPAPRTESTQTRTDTMPAPRTTPSTQAQAEPRPMPAPARQAEPTERVETVRPAPAQADAQADRQELPQTAGPLPLVAALGLLSLGGAFAARSIRRRSR